MYFVYILCCNDNTYYTGIAKNVEDRLKQHNSGKGAKYTRGRAPCRLIVSRKIENKSLALKLEFLVKKQKSHEEKVYKLLHHNNESYVCNSLYCLCNKL